ncbi:MAG TPA: membrane protein insertion efficiency factor YidD [Actinomycetota bacterium]|nr:membrane protein insertion efficiency factor YidD [Actinomycetota bacterium]
MRRARRRPTIPARALQMPVRAWRLVSVHLPPRCRFEPSCSEYALGALDRHGAARGSWLALRRLARCHPWHPGGFDPVPPPRAEAVSTNTRSPYRVPEHTAETC